ncbi:hypothetical protein [Variovorax sp. YR752]|uniref:hypothetical protein n=1 Tax=Variovorax sp. YR752 TaxID=1884383 RepID=UPI00313802C4
MPYTMVLPATELSGPPCDPPVGAVPASHSIVELDSAEQFVRLFERHASRSRRVSDALSALRLEVQVDGPPAGELQGALLAECAERLCAQVRACDQVVRWEPTQFGVLVPGCTALRASAVLFRLARAASGDYRLDGRLLHLRVTGQVLVPRTDGAGPGGA